MTRKSELDRHRRAISDLLVQPVVASGAFVEPAIGKEKPEYRFSQSTGMAFSLAQRMYRERFGNDVAWVDFFHPVQRRKVLQYACEHGLDLSNLSRVFIAKGDQPDLENVWVTLFSSPDVAHIGGFGHGIPEHYKVAVVEYGAESRLIRDHYYLHRHKVGCFWLLQKFGKQHVDGKWVDVAYPSVFEGSTNHYLNCAYGPYWRVSPALAGKSAIFDHWAENPEQGPLQVGFKVIEWGLLEPADIQLL